MAPSLRGGRRDAARAVLVLPGGREQSQVPSRPTQLAYLRMVDLYAGLRRATADTAVYLLRYRVRGWNGGDGFEPSPVADARWALERIHAAHPAAPIAVLGHSMGARAAFAVADAPGVVGVCALAPWLPDQEPLPAGHDLACVLAHGTADRTTAPAQSRSYAVRLRQHGVRVALFEQQGGRHALLDEPVLWHRFAVRTTVGLVGAGSLPTGVQRAFAADTGAITHPLRDFDDR